MPPKRSEIIPSAANGSKNASLTSYALSMFPTWMESSSEQAGASTMQDSDRTDGNQQICPVKSEILNHFSSHNRPNPVEQARGKNVLDAFEASLCFENAFVSPEQLLFAPQGCHPHTGQALPPLFNQKESLATGETQAAVTRSVEGQSYAFQVINNNITVTQPSSALRVQHPVSRSATVRTPDLAPKKRIKKPGIKFRQLHFSASNDSNIQNNEASGVVPNCKFVRQILIDWVKATVGRLHKPLMSWTESERNQTITVKDKDICNKGMYIKRKKIALAFFHFCSERSVQEYENQFSALLVDKMIAKNLKRSEDYWREHNLSNVFQKQCDWIAFTTSIVRKDEIKNCLDIQ